MVILQGCLKVNVTDYVILKILRVKMTAFNGNRVEDEIFMILESYGNFECVETEAENPWFFMPIWIFCPNYQNQSSKPLFPPFGIGWKTSENPDIV